MSELRQKIYSKKRMTMANVIAGMATGGFTGYFLYECQQCSYDCMHRSCLGDPRTPEHSAEVLVVSMPSSIQSSIGVLKRFLFKATSSRQLGYNENATMSTNIIKLTQPIMLHIKRSRNISFKLAISFFSNFSDADPTLSSVARFFAS